MINTMWATGKRSYTAKELNTFVGTHENQTRWKQWNKNPYYTTRTYQTALKSLGCITRIKRGLWQINGPIPEWFCSYHINAASSKSALEQLEKSCLYWQSLPDEHKINPWGNIIDWLGSEAPETPRLNTIFNALETAYNNTYSPMKTSVDYTMTLITVSDIIFTTKFPLLTGRFQVSVSTREDGSFEPEVVDWEYLLEGKSIGTATAEDLFRAYGETASSALEGARKIATEQAINALKRDALNAELEAAKSRNTADKAGSTKDGARYYSEAEVKQILQEFIDFSKYVIENTVQDSLDSVDASDVVDISVGYGFELEVNLDLRSVVSDVRSVVTEGLEEVLEGFDIEAALANY